MSKPDDTTVEAYCEIHASSFSPELAISEPFQAENSLEDTLEAAKRSEENFRTILATIPALVWAAAADGYAKFFSQRWFDYTGISYEDAKGHGWPSAVYAEDRDIILGRWMDIISSKRPGEVEARFRRSDGEYRWHLFRAAPRFDDLGAVAGWYGVNIDIEDQKQAEMELRRQEAARRKAEADLAHVTRVTTMGELTASIAHEVNQPITGVLINGKACLGWLAGLPEDSTNLVEAREAVKRIIRDGTRAGELISRIRALCKNAETCREPIAINEMIGEVVALARSEMGERQVVLALRLASELPLIFADRIQLQQVLINLILNGMEAMTTVEDRPRELAITTRIHSSDELLVLVKDSGIGIEAEDMEHIFTAFHTTKPNGLGMGLSISQKIVRSHEGRLWVTANDGPGVTFQFTVNTDSRLSQTV